MFDIGFLELLLIGVVGLLVLGPERLPKAARTVGLWVGRIKRSVSGMQREISAQLEAEELRQKLAEQDRKLNAGLDQARRDVERSVEGEPPRRETSPAPSADTADPAAHEPVEASTAPESAPPASADKDSTPR
ncbi:twin-arginine translocase subunit TatB [Modicisalibacter tunisiensis]|uniref:Sec-independent protein translocase protein TatB n=1 Tax=Modicisalibacter tunisiensis TaxID=390637 RepID=UPI001CCEBB86|nr:Sec-independent protein translocase protein TatB [Modicisalibacter tunisiensis]MBZ9539137.1 twin-arginine translocase subunit TatB [Modicisalibacter tunisiensis]